MKEEGETWVRVMEDQGSPSCNKVKLESLLCREVKSDTEKSDCMFRERNEMPRTDRKVKHYKYFFPIKQRTIVDFSCTLLYSMLYVLLLRRWRP
jgi:hypothetical protein